MTDFKIDKNVPIPAKRTATKYPLAEMAVNDSFFISCTDGKKQRSIRSDVSISARRVGVKVSTRVVPGGVRVWRVA